MIFKKNASKSLLTKIKSKPLPKHIAVIMDGNGRWAKKRGLPRTAGHNEGGKTLSKTLKTCNELGIQALTVYAFSTENWTRSEDEVKHLMNLPGKYIDRHLPEIKQENIRMNFIGNFDELSEELQNHIKRSEEETKDNTGLIFTIALNYGSKDEIIKATKQLAQDVVDQIITIESIDCDLFESKLMTHDLPKLDLLIRTSGEYRISNYLLWQIAYSELYFTSKLWPDFNEFELYKAIDDFQSRNRRYGGVKGEQ